MNIIMMDDLSHWRNALPKAEHYRALEIAIPLRAKVEASYPWAMVTEIQDGNMHRMNAASGSSFKAFDPESKLIFTWSIEWFGSDDAGNRETYIDVKRLSKIAAYLPSDNLRARLAAQLGNYILAMEARADELQKHADEIRSDVRRVRQELGTGKLSGAQ